MLDTERPGRKGEGDKCLKDKMEGHMYKYAIYKLPLKNGRTNCDNII